MTSITFRAQAQRSDGTKFIDCELYQATSFAVVKTEKFVRYGQRYTVHRVVERCKTLTIALASANARTQVLAPPDRKFVLGGRHPAGGKPLYPKAK